MISIGCCCFVIGRRSLSNLQCQIKLWNRRLMLHRKQTLHPFQFPNPNGRTINSNSEISVSQSPQIIKCIWVSIAQSANNQKAINNKSIDDKFPISGHSLDNKIEMDNVPKELSNRSGCITKTLVETLSKGWSPTSQRRWGGGQRLKSWNCIQPEMNINIRIRWSYEE